uniref:Uncharacterized protein n=1 Tax=Glossina austeni TaxID=7395 RepID=A0A1A9VBJ8_GLOAU
MYQLLFITSKYVPIRGEERLFLNFHDFKALTSRTRTDALNDFRKDASILLEIQENKQIIRIKKNPAPYHLKSLDLIVINSNRSEQEAIFRLKFLSAIIRGINGNEPGNYS